MPNTTKEIIEHYCCEAYFEPEYKKDVNVEWVRVDTMKICPNCKKERTKYDKK